MAIKLYWCRGRGHSDPSQRNFGDYLSPLIVEMVSGTTVSYAPIYKAEMMAIGSIMPREAKAKRFLLPRRLHVWGSGTDAPDRVFSGRHYYHAVRGVLTRDQIAGDVNRDGIGLGDPGLLADYWWEGRPRPEVRYSLGFIPHFSDRQEEVVRYASKLPGVKVIDVFWPVEEVLRSIQECRFIISSSLHGLIVADAFGVPNRRIMISRGWRISDYKFSDYYSAFGIDEPKALSVGEFTASQPGNWDHLIGDYARPGLAEVKSNLLSSFPSFLKSER